MALSAGYGGILAWYGSRKCIRVDRTPNLGNAGPTGSLLARVPYTGSMEDAWVAYGSSLSDFDFWVWSRWTGRYQIRSRVIKEIMAM